MKAEAMVVMVQAPTEIVYLRGKKLFQKIISKYDVEIKTLIN